MFIFTSGDLLMRKTGEKQLRKFDDFHLQFTVLDGLKGYVANTDLPCNKVIENYIRLCIIEIGFRISKTGFKSKSRLNLLFLTKKRQDFLCFGIAFIYY